jgi:hypothetical protein
MELALKRDRHDRRPSLLGFDWPQFTLRKALRITVHSQSALP